MQKKILSAVLSLLLVGSANLAFAGYYVDKDIDVDVDNSFNRDDHSDDDGLDLDITDSFKKDIDVNKTVNVSKTKTLNKTMTLDISKVEDSYNTETDQGNDVKGHIVIQQFGTQGGGNGAGGDMVVLDQSINHSTINSNNTVDSYNKDVNINKSYTRTNTRSLNLNIDNSFNKSLSLDDSFNSEKWVDIDVAVDRSFNRIGGHPYGRP